jgi:hypothetical protein
MLGKPTVDGGSFVVMPLWPRPLRDGLGTIPENGLYATHAVPNDPTITVKAIAEADLGETVSAIVTIVPPDPSQHTVRQ